MNQYTALERMKSAVLCRFWRNSLLTNNTTAKLAKNFSDKGLLFATMETMKLEEMTIFLKQTDTIQLAQQYLMRIQRLSNLLHGTALLPHTLFNIRVFLASYMILIYPESAFQTMGDLETLLLESTKKLHSNFEAILDALTNEKKMFREIPHELTKAFPVLLEDFLDRFSKWKVVDEVNVIARIKHALIALLEARRNLMFDDCITAEMSFEFLNQLKRLKDKLLQIGGPDVVKDFERENPDLKCLESQNNSKESISDREYYKEKYTTNEQMAHELLLDPTFELTEANSYGSFNATQEGLKKNLERAFWTGLEDDLRFSPPCYVRITRVLSEIRDGIVELGDEYLKGEQIMDINLLIEKIKTNVWDWPQITQLVNALFQNLQIIQFSNRVDETMTLWEETKKAMDNASHAVESQNTTFCKAMRFLLERVQVFRLDAANRRLRSIAPVILDHGIEYEQDKMKEKLESGALTTNRTHAWLKQSIACLLEYHSTLVQNLVQGNAAAIATAYGSALVDLIENKTIPVPETLMFDIHRIDIMRHQYQKLVVYSIVLVTVKHYIGNAAAEAEMVAQFVAAESALDWKNSCISIGGAIVGMDRLDGYMKEVEKRLADPSDPVHALMRTRVRAFWEKAVDGPRTTIEELRGVEGLKTIASEWTAKLALLAKFNMQIHGPLYNDIMPLAAIEARSH